jgi:hypothetical protein
MTLMLDLAYIGRDLEYGEPFDRAYMRSLFK